MGRGDAGLVFEAALHGWRDKPGHDERIRRNQGIRSAAREKESQILLETQIYAQ
jgi:hypothetical protein